MFSQENEQWLVLCLLNLFTEAKVESRFSQAGYLEANGDGYYTCQANISLKINDDVSHKALSKVSKCLFYCSTAEYVYKY